MHSEIDIKLLKKIARSGHQILLRKADYGRISIPYLHFLSAHPNNLSRYKAILIGTSNYKIFWLNFLSRIIILLMSLRPGRVQCRGDNLSKNVDILFVSHFLREEDAHIGSGIYFGSLPEDLQDRNIETFTVLIDHAKIPWRKLRSKWKTFVGKRAILPSILDFKAELGFDRRLSATAKCLRDEIKIEQDLQMRKILYGASIDAGSPNSRTALRIGENIRRVVNETNAKVIVTTFEGHSWERLAFASAREVNPNIVCVGYHHAVIFPMQYAMMSSLGERYDPNLIFTAGEITKEHYSVLSRYNNTPIRCLGSCRGTEASTLAKTAQKDQVCLILPEGIISESLSMIWLAIEAADIHTDVQFIIRLHPLVTRDKLVGIEASLANLPKNVRWSSSSLAEDCKSARWSIYRGSSTILSAILAGTQPIYYAQEPAELQIDPIKTLNCWRVSVKNPVELAEHFTEDLDRSDTNRNSDLRTAQTFALKYFSSFSPEKIVEQLPEVKSKT